MARKAPRIELSEKGRKELEGGASKPTGQQRKAQRARIVLLASLGWDGQAFRLDLRGQVAQEIISIILRTDN